MALKDVKAQPQELPTRHSCLGTIRLGIKGPTQSGKIAPQATGYYVFKDAPKLAEHYGDERVTSLPVRFPFQTFDENVQALYRVWATRVCLCSGDGVQVVRALPFSVIEKDDGPHVYRAKGEPQVSRGVAVRDLTWRKRDNLSGVLFREGEAVPCPGRERNNDERAYRHCALCSPNILINVSLDDQELYEFGYYRIPTRSMGNYQHLLSVWNLITEYGRLDIPMDRIPFVLEIVQLGTLYMDKDMGWQTGESYFLRLRIADELAVALMKHQAAQFASTLARVGRGLPAPQAEPTGDDVLATEFAEPSSEGGAVYEEADFVEAPPGPSPEPETPETPEAGPTGQDELAEAPEPAPEPEKEPPEVATTGPTLDRTNKPKNWTAFYEWAQAGGYTNAGAFKTVKAAYPHVTSRRMCRIEEAVQALIDDEDYQLAEAQETDEAYEGIPKSETPF